MDENLNLLLVTNNEEFQNKSFDSQFSEHFMDLQRRKAEFDLEILCNNDNVIPIHQQVLIERCRYFKNMLQSNLKETNATSVSFAFDVVVVETIIQYLYSGTISLNGENVIDIIITSSYMQQDDLTKICMDFLMKNISCKTAHILLKFAEENFVHKLNERVMKYIENNFKDYINHTAMLQWPYKLVKKVLSSDNIRVSSEEPVLKFLCNWLDAEFDERKEIMDDLLHEIRFSFLTTEKISATINEDVRLKIHQQCFKFMNDCLENSTQHKERHCYDRIYLFGGLNSNKEHIFERYFPKDNSVKSLTPPSTLSAFYKSICVNGNLYRIGGFIPYSSPIKFLNRVEMYDPVVDRWSSVSSMNSERCCHAVCQFDDEIYCFGGINHSNLTDDKEKFLHRPNLANEVYNLLEDQWKVIDDGEPNLGICMEAVQIGDCIFLLCETLEQSRLTLRQYMPRSNEWVEIRDCPSLANHGRFFNMVSNGTKLFVFQSNNYVDVYDTVKKDWGSRFFARRYVACRLGLFRSRPLIIVCNGLFYIIGERVWDWDEDGKNGPYFSRRIGKLFQFKTYFQSEGNAKFDGYHTTTNFFKLFSRYPIGDTSRFLYLAEEPHSYL